MANHTIFDVLNTLEKAKISFRLARDRPDTIRVDTTSYGLRLEIECFDEDHVDVSTFRGTEDIDGEYDYFLKRLSDNSMDWILGNECDDLWRDCGGTERLKAEPHSGHRKAAAAASVPTTAAISVSAASTASGTRNGTVPPLAA
jgi:hypothetical protein